MILSRKCETVGIKPFSYPQEKLKIEDKAKNNKENITTQVNKIIADMELIIIQTKISNKG